MASFVESHWGAEFVWRYSATPVELVWWNRGVTLDAFDDTDR